MPIEATDAVSQPREGGSRKHVCLAFRQSIKASMYRSFSSACCSTTKPAQAGPSQELPVRSNTRSPARETLCLSSPVWEGRKSNQQWRVGNGTKVEVFQGLCSQTIISFGEFYCPSTGKQVTQWPLAVLSSVLSFDSRIWASFPFVPLYSELHDCDLGQVLMAPPLISSTGKHRWQ